MSRFWVFLVWLAAGGCWAGGRGWAEEDAPARGPGLYAEIETTKGTLTAELFFERAPLTVMNFIGLAEGALPASEGAAAGKPFFDGLTFHRVVADFVVQGGDPRGDGEGGPGYQFPDEFAPGLRHDKAGVLSMANDGPDTNGSQFFITLRETHRLNYLHAVFGQVVGGLEVLGRIAPGDKMLRVTIRRVGPAAEGVRASGEAFEAVKQAVLGNRRPAAPAGFAYFADEAGTLPEFRVKNFNFKLANYERTTGHRLAVRVFAEDASESQARRRTKAVGGELGLSGEGDNALACLFAGSRVWKLRLGEETFPALLGRGGPAGEMMRGRFLHEQKSALLALAQGLLGEGKVKESCDAVIDGLILGLDDFALRKER